MNWPTIKLGIPYGIVGGILGGAWYILLDPLNFDIFDTIHRQKLISTSVAGCITCLGSYFRGLYATLPWDGLNRRQEEDK